jgi:hypothetical protein
MSAGFPVLSGSPGRLGGDRKVISLQHKCFALVFVVGEAVLGDSGKIRHIAVPGLEAGTGPFSNVVLDGSYAFVSGVVASDVAGGSNVEVTVTARV